jgi:hypothetical protein
MVDIRIFMENDNEDTTEVVVHVEPPLSDVNKGLMADGIRNAIRAEGDPTWNVFEMAVEERRGVSYTPSS